MNRRPTPSVDPGESADSDDPPDWREQFLGRVRYLLYVMMVIGGVLLTAASRTPDVQLLGVFVGACALVLVFVVSHAQWSIRTRATAVVVALVVIELGSYRFIGLTGGVALAAAYALFTAALLLGRRAMILTLSTLVLGSLAILLAIKLGFMQEPSALESDLSDPLVWTRITLVSAAVWALICFSVLFVIQKIEADLAGRTRALAKLRRETDERKAAERARLDAERVAAEAQKLDAVGRLAANAAHDFSNALTVIELWVSLLKDSDLDKDQRAGLAAIEEASRQGGQLAQKMLTFARKDAFNPRYLAIDDVIKRTATVLQTALGADIEFRVDARSDSAVYADETQLQQILFNLIFNARDAMTEGGAIAVGCRMATGPDVDKFGIAQPTANEWLLLSVQDNGSGIDESDIDRILEPFFSTKPAGKGTGLGLSIVVGIVRRSGGQLRIESEVGAGTTVSIILPAADLALLSDTAPDDMAGTDLAGMRVLVLEDDPVAGALIQKILQRQGADTVWCTNGNEAAATIVNEPEPFDLLCTDAVFPGVKLPEIISKAEQQSPNVRVLVCSGYLPEEIDLAGIQSGKYGFLPKPFNAQRLLAKINDVRRGH